MNNERTCGSCMMCCKLPIIPSLNKASGRWCFHAKKGSGCTIYSARPGECKTFFCEWMIDPNLGAEWKPETSKFITIFRPETKSYIIMPDVGTTNWRNEPYYSELKRKAAYLLDRGIITTVFISENKLIILFPDEDKEVRLQTGETYRISGSFADGRPRMQVIISSNSQQN